MKTLWILAAAATFAACHSRSEETGAAPDRGDTTAVRADTTQAAPTPAPADTGMKKDTTTAVPSPDTTTAVPSPSPDTTAPAAPQNPTYDTTSTTVPPSGGVDTTTNPTPPANPAPGAATDTTMAPPTGDTTMPHDSTSPDSSSAR